MFAFPLFMLGLAVGSYINVLSMRYQEDAFVFSKDSTVGRSHCPKCGKTLAWYELIPLASFIIQRGKCRSCGVKLSWQYPVVELMTGITFALVPARVHDLLMGASRQAFGLSYETWMAILWVAAAAFFILISVIDFRERIIPDELNVALAGIGLVSVAVNHAAGAFGVVGGSLFGRYAPLLGFRDNIFINHALAFAFGVIFFGLIIAATRGRAMGMGDLKLSAAAGAFLGWPDILFSTMFAFLVGSLVSIALIAYRKKKLSDAVPFAPFIVAGIAIAFFFGEAILDAYFGLFSI